MARDRFPQSVPPPYSDAGPYTRLPPPQNSRPYQGDLLGSYGSNGFTSSRPDPREADQSRNQHLVDPWGMRRDVDPAARVNHAGRGPKGWSRTDESIREGVCDMLDANPDIDAREIEVSVQSGEVTLTGHVENRAAKRRAEDIIATLPGVNDVHNRLAVDAQIFGKTAR